MIVPSHPVFETAGLEQRGRAGGEQAGPFVEQQGGEAEYDGCVDFKHPGHKRRLLILCWRNITLSFCICSSRLYY